MSEIAVPRRVRVHQSVVYRAICRECQHRVSGRDVWEAITGMVDHYDFAHRDYSCCPHGRIYCPDCDDAVARLAAQVLEK